MFNNNYLKKCCSYILDMSLKTICEECKTICQQQQEPIIIYKTYTPQRKAYCKKYYQENKERILGSRNQRYKEIREKLTQDPEFNNKKEYNDRYLEKLKNDPERLEKHQQNQKEQYAKRKALLQSLRSKADNVSL